MALKMVTMSEEYAAQMCGWRYSGPYAVYNLAPWEEMVSAGISAMVNAKEREREFKAFVEDDGRLMAVCRHTLRENGRISIGIGVNPDYLSMGYGHEALGAFLQWLSENYDRTKFYLMVRIWNERAIKCYEKFGFKIHETIVQNKNGEDVEFYEMRLG